MATDASQERLERHRKRGWSAGLRCQPDCRHHLLEPYRTAYGEQYDAAVEYRRREGIDFWTAKTALAARCAGL